MRSVLTLAAVVALSFGVAGNAAAQDGCQTSGRLASAAGSVMVDKGNGFVPGVVGTALKTGDKVSVRGQGNAVVDFGNNRTVTVPSSTTETLRAPGCGLDLTNSGSANPALGIAATLAVGGGLAAAISAADSSSGTTIITPVSP
ncbi:hypothetical protein [Ancylobacter sp. IITR112]|uniref:hypothetical protein n=1 Tax=Ancylobacter sp. IITR112 TaxID=3138073 RepID=UPI00352B491E